MFVMTRRSRFSPTMFYPILNWFIPVRFKEDNELLQRARMFLVSHLIGPFLGHTITVYLYILDPQPGYALGVLSLSITLFLAFPFALKWTGWYTGLAVLSVQNLIFAILWGCYNYGGVSSPFLPWLLTVPLLAFFYLGSGARQRLLVISLLGFNLAAFYVIYINNSYFPQHIPLFELSGIGIISTLAAAVYVSIMAMYYGNVVASQSQLELEVHRHLATARQLREAKSEADRANRAKSDFLARMSHELRTPLNAVIGYSEMLLEDAEAAGDVDQTTDLKRIHTAGKHLLTLVSSVLDLSKLEAGKMELYVERFELGTLVEGIAASSADELAANGNKLIVDCQDKMVAVNTDKTKLFQATLNVMANAARFTRNGTVTLSSKIEDGWIKISVRDTGPGIRPENVRNLFENFGEAEGATSSKYGGTGLGLALSRKLCRLLGGEIGVQSDYGKGACFTLRVPTAPEDEDAATGVVTRDSDKAICAERPILIIDDDPSVLDLVQRILEKGGYRVITAQDPYDGITLARESQPAAIILDIAMPKLDGWEVLKALKAQENLCRCPVILLTNNESSNKWRILGAVGHLQKPVDRESLLLLLSDVCQQANVHDVAMSIAP
jgi:signal transduction histidine kinase/CheY-like chemotaxis protein